MLSVCCNGWRPCEVLENSCDERILGVQLFLLHVMACETIIKELLTLIMAFGRNNANHSDSREREVGY